MKVTCPTCGRGTLVDAEIGDFPTRCQRCGGLLRKPPTEAAAGPTGLIKGLSLRRADPPGGPSARVARGTLAGLLSARQAAEFAPAAINSLPPSAAVAVLDAPSFMASATALADPPPAQQPVLRPESRREIARVAARQKALRRAQLRGNLQALGALGWLGLIVIGILVVSALVLQAHAMWQHS